jgi:hypothetical protein
MSLAVVVLKHRIEKDCLLSITVLAAEFSKFGAVLRSLDLFQSTPYFANKTTPVANEVPLVG